MEWSIEREEEEKKREISAMISGKKFF